MTPVFIAKKKKLKPVRALVDVRLQHSVGAHVLDRLDADLLVVVVLDLLDLGDRIELHNSSLNG